MDTLEINEKNMTREPNTETFCVKIGKSNFDELLTFSKKFDIYKPIRIFLFEELLPALRKKQTDSDKTNQEPSSDLYT